MENLFSSSGISAWDFLRFSVAFLTVMLGILSLKDRKYTWLRYVGLGGFSIQWLAAVLFPGTLATRFFATLLLISLLVVEIALGRKRRAEFG